MNCLISKQPAFPPGPLRVFAPRPEDLTFISCAAPDLPAAGIIFVFVQSLFLRLIGRTAKAGFENAP
jgi:hypothetical protein